MVASLVIEQIVPLLVMSLSPRAGNGSNGQPLLFLYAISGVDGKREKGTAPPSRAGERIPGAWAVSFFVSNPTGEEGFADPPQPPHRPRRKPGRAGRMPEWRSPAPLTGKATPPTPPCQGGKKNQNPSQPGGGASPFHAPLSRGVEGVRSRSLHARKSS